jgi:[ribosomal protein S18]-alanine N-acetyltransferase
MPENTFSESIRHTRILEPKHLGELYYVWCEIINTGADEFFKPHPFSLRDAVRVCNNRGKDLYIAAFVNAEIAAYGMLRGWDAGYSIPSIGIYVCRKFQGKGFGRWFMGELHRLASERGAEKIRLTVLKNNQKAISLYKKLGYVLDGSHPEYFEGFLSLKSS